MISLRHANFKSEDLELNLVSLGQEPLLSFKEISVDFACQSDEHIQTLLVVLLAFLYAGQTLFLLV